MSLSALSVAYVTITTLDIDEVEGVYSEADYSDMVVESQELLTSGDTVTGAKLVLNHSTGHKVRCDVNARLKASSGVVASNESGSITVFSDRVNSTTLTFSGSPKTDDYRIFNMTAVNCQ
ncbi:MAG: hypothetical protein SXQ77_03960, partial [Halobacteria archaeon]|nr:hypothetical protein [Halobacteria archaeon]